MNDEEMIEILEGIARRGSTSAKVQAVRMLLELRKSSPTAENAVNEPLAELDDLDAHRRAKGRPKPKAG
jgi:hypothetical protein